MKKWNTYAKILGNHTAALLTGIATDGPYTTHSLEPPEDRPFFELAARITFEGVLAETRQKGRGHIVCGVVNLTNDRPLLKDMAAYLGLGADALETENGPQNILNEFLNVVIGLAGSTWSEHGFAINFSTPRALSGQPMPPPAPDHQSFHVVVSSPHGLQVDILVVFREYGRPAA